MKIEFTEPKHVDFYNQQCESDAGSMLPVIATFVVLIITLCMLILRHYLWVEGLNTTTNELKPDPSLSNSKLWNSGKDHETKPAYTTQETKHNRDKIQTGYERTQRNSNEKRGLLNKTESKHEDHDRMSHLEHLLKLSTTTGDGPLPLTYNLHCETTMTNRGNRLRKCILGQKCDASKSVTRKSEKVIMVVGATGAGKTTLINGMVNYVLGVKWEDYFRFEVVVDEGEEQIQNAAVSQTQWITAYTLHHQKYFNVPFTLTIVDTPGLLGGTRGIEQDTDTIKQMANFLHGTGADFISHLTAIGFVVRAPYPSLSHSYKSIFDSVLSLFGKDVAQNIYLMVTFADGQKPPVMSSVRDAKIPFTASFKFNNSALFANNTGRSRGDDDDIGFDKMSWQMGLKSYNTFFQALKTAENKSLQLTKDVLKERLTLETYVEGIHVQLQLGLNKLHQLKTEVEVLHLHQVDIDRNKKFEYTVTEDIAVKHKHSNGQYTITCLCCNFTCHEMCPYNDNNKIRCCAMSNGNCTVCPGKCHWTKHISVPYKIIMESRMVTKTSTDMKDKYEKALGKKLLAEELIDQTKQDFEEVQVNIVFLTEQIRCSVEKLDDIALRPNLKSALEYIDLLIEAEKRDHKPGWSERVQQLEGARRKAELIYDVKGGNFDPFEEYEEERTKLLKKGGGTETSYYLRKIAAGLKKRISEQLSG